VETCSREISSPPLEWVFTIPSSWLETRGGIIVRKLRYVLSEIDTGDLRSMRFDERNKKLLAQQSRKVLVIDLGAGSNKFGEYWHQTLVSGKTWFKPSFPSRPDSSLASDF